MFDHGKVGEEEAAPSSVVYAGVQGRDRRAVPARRSVDPGGGTGLRSDRDGGAGMGQAGRTGQWRAGRRWVDGRGAGGVGPAASRQPPAARGRRDPQAGHGLLREGDPVNVYPFIEAEKAGDHNVKGGVSCWRSPVPPTTRSAPTSPPFERVRTPS